MHELFAAILKMLHSGAHALEKSENPKAHGSLRKTKTLIDS